MLNDPNEMPEFFKKMGKQSKKIEEFKKGFKAAQEAPKGPSYRQKEKAKHKWPSIYIETNVEKRRS